MITRRFAISSAVAAALAGLTRRDTLAQYTAQEVSNGLQVTATGDVKVDQAASGQQGIFVNGIPADQDGVYRTSTGQLVVNDGQITATGDVTVTQSASGTQTIQQNLGLYNGAPADSCKPGHVIADPTTGILYYQANDCCYYVSRCCASDHQGCKSGKC